MRRGLVAVDRSGISEALMRYAFRYARLEGLEELDFLHVVESQAMLLADWHLVIPETREERESRLMRSFQDSIASAADDSCDSAVSWKLMIEFGVPYSEIVRKAQEGEYEIVLIGHRGMSDLERFFIGSVAARVARHAPCTVLVYRPEGG